MSIAHYRHRDGSVPRYVGTGRARTRCVPADHIQPAQLRLEVAR